jgi:hypothetical protein
MRGYQDTYYTYGLGRIYMKDCYVEGAVDYIFGQATVVFDSCEFNIVRYGAPLTAASTHVSSTFGYVFRNCKIMTPAIGYDGKAVTGVYLGRPWQGNPKVVFMFCYEPPTLAAAGWTSMNSGLNPLFAEYKCFGPGYKPELRSTNVNYQGIQLTDQEAAAYTLENIFARITNPAFGIDWMPDTSSFKLSQSIHFDPLQERRMGEAPFDLEGNATSNLPLSYESSNPGVAAISGNTVTLTGMGTTDITASQEGNFLYGAAASVVQTLTVGEPSELEDETAPDLQLFPNPAVEKIIIRGLTTLPERMIIVDETGQIRLEKMINSEMAVIDISFLPAGLYLIKMHHQTYRFIVE